MRKTCETLEALSRQQVGQDGFRYLQGLLRCAPRFSELSGCITEPPSAPRRQCPRGSLLITMSLPTLLRCPTISWQDFSQTAIQSYSLQLSCMDPF